MDSHVMPAPAAIERVVARAKAADDGPVLMLNINRYTEAAAYPDGEGYTTYMDRLHHSVRAGGGDVLWRAPVTDTVIGCDHDGYDEILAVWYPSHRVFLDLGKADGADLMFESRTECVENATILSMPGDVDPLRPAG